MADNEVQIVINATDNASAVIQALSQTFRTVAEDASKVVDEYVDYGKQVEVTSSYLDISTEAASRLIQVGNEAEVSYDTLKMAAKKMATDGIAPSTDALATLSDQFLAISDPLRRTQFLIDNFGRSGEEMSKIMVLGGAEIRNMSKDVSDSLVIDQKKADAIKKTKDEEIAFNQSMEGLKYDAAGKLLDIFNALPGPMQTTVQLLGAVGQSGMLMQFSQLSILFTEISKAGGLGKVFTEISVGIKAFGAASLEAMGPWAALAGAIWVFYHAFADNWDMFEKMFAVIAWAFTGNLPSWAWDIKPSTGPLNVQNSFLNPGGKASGGDASGWDWVGEKGPELRYSPQGSHIFSNADSARMLGGTTVNVYYQPAIGMASEDDVRKMAPLIKRSLRYAA